MNWETAKKAVDWFYDHSNHPEKGPDISRDKVSISFYGGEPLLSFPLLKDVVNYVNTKFTNRHLNYYITSNLTILTEDMIYFLVKNQFKILVSLDGPRAIHDRYRVDPNGKGTFAIVEKNLKKIMTMSKDYYKQRIGFNMVLAPPNNFEAIEQFINSSDLFYDETGIRFNYVDSLDTDFYKQFKNGEWDLSKNREQFVTRYIALCNNSEIGKVRAENRLTQSMLISTYKTIFKYIFSGETLKFKNVFVSNRLCNPGLNRLFVNTEGNFFPCERVAEGKNMIIGNVNDGINSNKCFDLVNTYFQLVNDECVNCWALRFCNLICYKGWMDREIINNKRRKEMCHSLRRMFNDAIIHMIHITEESPNALELFIDKSPSESKTQKSI
jgi:uncharacterized protein